MKTLKAKFRKTESHSSQREQAVSPLPPTTLTLPGGSTTHKRKAPPPPKSPRQRQAQASPDLHPGPAPCLEPDSSTSASPSPTPTTQHSIPDNLAEDEEVFEEIRRLRLERGHLLQKIKALELQQNSTTNALEELNSLRECLREAEAERDCLEVLLKQTGGVRLSGTTCSINEPTDDMLDFPDASRLLSKQSQRTEVEMPPGQPENSSWGQMNSVEQLCRQVEDLTAQNAELALKVQMLEMFEKDDTGSGLDFVPMTVYDSLKREFEKLQQQNADAMKSSNTAQEHGSEDISEDVGEAESKEGEGLPRETAEQEEKRKSLEQQLACAHAELEEFRKQMGIDFVTAGLAVRKLKAEDSSDLQRLAARVQELEVELAEKEAALKEGWNESDRMQELNQKVQELEESLQAKEKEAQDMSESVEKLRNRVQELEMALERGTGTSCLAESKEESQHTLKLRVAALEVELSKRVPREQMEEVQVTLGIQLNQLARERSEIAMRLNQALLDLERLCPPAHTDKDDSDEDDNTEQQSDLYKPSSALEPQGGRTLSAVLEELEETSQPDMKELNDLFAGTEDSVQDALKKKDGVPLAKHQEALSEIVKQLAETKNKLQAETALCEQAHAEIARLKHDLQEAEHGMISTEEHVKILAELQRTLEESQSALAAAHEALSVKELELKELQLQKAIVLDMVSKEDHEAQRVSLQAEINALTACLADLTRKHEKTCTEVFQVQREALFNKSERQAAEAQLLTVQQQLSDLQAQSSNIQQLHQEIQHSNGIIKEKDHKITELSKDVFRLKEALGALTPPIGLCSSTASSGNPGQQLAFQNRISALNQQLQDCERKHKTVVATYRSHLLAAVQGHMDEDVQELLYQILRMTQNNQRH